jgi:hypothetical protein
VIDIPEPRRSGSPAAAVFKLCLLAAVAALGWTYREPLTSFTNAIKKSYRMAFAQPGANASRMTPAVRPDKPEPPPPALPPGQTNASGGNAPPPSQAQPRPVKTVQPQSLGRLELKSRGPAASATWPSVVSVENTPEVKIVTEDAEARKFVYQTANYEFQSDSLVGSDAVREFSRVFEAAFRANCLLPLSYRPTPEQGRERFVARIFSTDVSYLAAGGIYGSAGLYNREQAAMLLPVRSIGMKVVNGRMQTDKTEATEVLIHEITHQMMNAWLPRLPLWFIEGSAEYMAMADYVHGRFMMSQPQDRLRAYINRRQPGLRNKAIVLALPELMEMTPSQWSQAITSKAASARQNYLSAAMLVYYFYHLEGRGKAVEVKAFLAALEEGMPERLATEKYLLHGRSPEELQADVANAFAAKGLTIIYDSRGLRHWKPLPQPKSVATATAAGH